MITTTTAILLATTQAPIGLQGIPAPIPPAPISITLEEPAQPVEQEREAIDTLRPQDSDVPVDQAEALGADDGEGMIVVTARVKSAGDPLEAVNLKSYEATAAIDGAIFEPVAMAYQKAVPTPVRSGLRNFLGNLHEPVVFVNFLLQHKVGKAAETIGRFVVNSTVGMVGLVDVAKSKPINLPRRPNGFSDTLGFYGVKTGAYLYLPLIGPTTVRDLVGKVADRMMVPMAIGGALSTPGYSLPINAVKELDRRSENDEQMRKLREDTNDPYLASREFYLQRRQREIDNLHGRPMELPVALPVEDESSSIGAKGP